VKVYEVEFYGLPVVRVEDENVETEEEAIRYAMFGHDWPGYSENTPQGVEFKVWVREVKE